MVTPILEKLILQGDANFKIHSHAFGMFGRLPMPPDGVAVITKIVWWPFLNPLTAISEGITWEWFFQLCEYQLKVDSNKGTDYLQFRNSLPWILTDPTSPIDMKAAVNLTDFNKMCFQPAAPVIQDTYIVCSDFIKLTVSRNVGMFSSQAKIGLVNEQANENAAPEGVKDIQTLQRMDASSAAGQSNEYQPPSQGYGSVPGSLPDLRFPYVNPLFKQVNVPPLTYESEIYTPDLPDGTAWDNMPFHIYPLVNFHVVYLNKNVAADLQTSK